MTNGKNTEHSEDLDTPARSALFLSAFFDELIRCGVQDVVVSPGSRSTPLAMVAYASSLRLHVDIDERGAAFYALGLAKASGRPACVICTSGTAVANYYPAILEAEASRVPLIVLTGDRPPQLQNLGAPQTCDQLNIYGRHVRHFQQMPLAQATPDALAFARQMAVVAFSQSVGGQASQSDTGEAWYGCISDAGPVHFNFPFEEPLKPNLSQEGLFICGRRSGDPRDVAMADRQDPITDEAQLDPVVIAHSYPDARTLASLMTLMQEKRTIVLCGEGTVVNRAEAQMLLTWAQAYHLPLLADPLSNLRNHPDPLVIDNYDNLFDNESCESIELVIRFGRYPVSKSCFSALSRHRPMQIVVDACETRDFNATTDVFVRCTPADFIASCMVELLEKEKLDEIACSKQCSESTDMAPAKINAPQVFAGQKAFATRWIERNNAEATRIDTVSQITQGFEGAFIHRLFDLAPKDSCVFSASSMAIRMVDTFYLKQKRDITLLCNRGLNGIDGCLSSALGAARYFPQTTFLVGDLALLHDVNALALQGELLRETPSEPTSEQESKDRLDRHPAQRLDQQPAAGAPSVIIVLVNNQGGGIFDILPQRSSDPYFERLFLTPQDVDFSNIAKGFKIPYEKTATVADFEKAYTRFVGKAGIHLIEVPAAAQGLKERYGDFLA